jgi:urocanate hydratase
MKRYSQGWVKEVCKDLKELIERVIECRRTKTATSIGFNGNIVAVWEYFLEYTKKTGDLLIDLASDQTSCHNPFLGGYYPVQV